MIWMLRYGLSFEDIEKLDNHIKSIGEGKIEFKDSIYQVDEMDRAPIERFLP
jgi:ATP-dependent RNA helicase DOB1